jgi:hypothetical protein
MVCADWSYLYQGYIRIPCPTSGTITYYKSDNTTTTVTCTADGIPMTPSTDWAALYVATNSGMWPDVPATHFKLVDSANTTFRVNDNWVLIAVVNRDNSIINLKWIPGMVDIPNGCTYNSLLAKINRPPLVIVASGATSIPNMTNTNISFATSDISSPLNGITYYNSTRRFTNTSGTTITVLVNYTVALSDNNAGVRISFIEVNSNTLLRYGDQRQQTITDSTWGNYLSGSGILSLAANSYFTISMYQTSGTTISATIDSRCMVSLI